MKQRQSVNECDIIITSFTVAVAENEVRWKGDRPYLKVKLGAKAVLTCCDAVSSTELKSRWIKETKTGNLTNVQASERISIGSTNTTGRPCGQLLFKHVHLSDSGMYHCEMNHSCLHKSPGTYMHVYSKRRGAWGRAK